MEVKNFFDPAVKAELIARINKLTPDTKGKWGKMNVAQMLAHLQEPLHVAMGTKEIKGTFFFNLLMPFFKKTLWDEKPWKKGLPTDKTYVKTNAQFDFETEKNKLLSLVNQFSEETATMKKHPVFGTMTQEQWSKSAWKHFDHHLQQFGV